MSAPIDRLDALDLDKGRRTMERLLRAGDRLADVAEDARGHYGIEECAKPYQPATEWDEIQESLQYAARIWRNVRAGLPGAQEGEDD